MQILRRKMGRCSQEIKRLSAVKGILHLENLLFKGIIGVRYAYMNKNMYGYNIFMSGSFHYNILWNNGNLLYLVER